MKLSNFEFLGSVGAALFVNTMAVPNLYELRRAKLGSSTDPQTYRAAQQAALAGLLGTLALAGATAALSKTPSAALVILSTGAGLYFAQRRFLDEPCSVCKGIERMAGL